MQTRRPVAFITPSLYGGGAERVLFDVITHLDRDRFQPQIVCFTKGRIPSGFDPEIRIHHLYSEHEVLDVGNALGNLWRRFCLLLRLRRLLSTFSPDCILVPFLELPAVHVWLSQLLARRSYIVSLHTMESIYMRIIYPNPVLRVAEEWLFSAACKSAARITIPSEGCKRDLINNYGIAAEAVKVIPNPIDNQAIEHLSSAPLEIETPHLNGRTLFLHVGRLVEQKNHRLLISACSLLRSRWDRFAVVCLGKGPLRDTIQSRIDDAGLKNHVFMLGEVQNPYPFMSQARALVLTSHFESFALVLVEAMACGAVPVAVDCPSGPREVLGNGKWGLLVPPGNAEALADAMWRIAHDEELYRALRDVGVERAQHYDVSRVVHAWETMLSEV